MKNKLQRLIEQEVGRQLLSEKKVDRFSQLDILIEYLGESEALDAIVRATSDSDFNETFEYIVRMNDIDY